MKFIDFVLLVFKKLIETEKYKIIPHKHAGRPITNQFENIFKSIVYQIKSGVWQLFSININIIPYGVLMDYLMNYIVLF